MPVYYEKKGEFVEKVEVKKYFNYLCLAEGLAGAHGYFAGGGEVKSIW